LDAFAEEFGVLFEDVTAPAAWTWPSHASLFTGEFPWVHGAHMALLRPSEDIVSHERIPVTTMRKDLPTLAERFAEHGYRTVALSANGWLDPELGLMRGFEKVEIFDEDAEVVAAAQELLSEDLEGPLFLFINLMAAHGPFRVRSSPWAERHLEALQPDSAPEWLRPHLCLDEPPGAHLVRRGGHLVSGVDRYLLGKLEIPPEGFEMLSDLYDGEVAYADRSFGEILSDWARVRPNSIAVVTSDHGELLGEHGLLDHRGNVYPELVKVPLIIAAPTQLPVGVRTETPVQLQDLYPTLLELTHIEKSPRSLVAVIGGEKRDGPILSAAWPFSYWARLVGGRLKHIWQLYRVGDEALVWSSGGDVELYDLGRDPGMTEDLSTQRPERAATLREAGAPLFGELAELSTPRVLLSGEARERLRELGYLAE
jgi:arylsulfatase A-like enzyme